MLFKIAPQQQVPNDCSFVKPTCNLSWNPRLTRQPKIRIPNDNVFEGEGLHEHLTFKVQIADLVRRENQRPRLWLKGTMKEDLYSLTKGDTVFTRLHFQNESYGKVFVIFNGANMVYPTETYGGNRLKKLVFYDPITSVLSKFDSDKIEKEYRLRYFP